MVEAMMIKRADGLFEAATPYDAEQLGSLKIGKGYKMKLTQGSNRSVQHHRLFFGGLLPLAFGVWQPSGGLVNESEEQFARGFARNLDALAGNDDHAFEELFESYLDAVAQKRAEKLGAPPAMDVEQFRKWLIVKAGYFETKIDPSGIRKVPKSISFASMSQEEFNAFYKNCFAVAWNLLLNSHFESEEQAQQAALALLEVGG